MASKNNNILLDDIKRTFDKCYLLAQKKNNDYAGKKSQDVYKNIKASNFVGVTPDRAILVRMMDKIARVSNLLSQENAVKDESIYDTLNDIINYAAILSSYLKNNKRGN